MNIKAQDIFSEFEERQGQPKAFTYKKLALFLAILYLFLFSLELISASAKSINPDFLKTILANPFVGLVIGLLATAIFQSSSTTTSMLVAFVATGTISIETSVSVVIGANIGTTITAIITSVGYISGKKEFKKAVSAAFSHHTFKLVTAIILFPLELYFHFLSNLSIKISSYFNLAKSPSDDSSSMFYQYMIDPFVDLINNNINISQIYILIFSLLILLISIKLFIFLLKNTLFGESQNTLNRYVFNGPYVSFSWGVFVTALIHSSTATTSFMVPMVATEKVSLRKAFPFIIGANIGTTFTALVAASNKTQDALSIALVHFMFNFIGMLMFFPIPYLRQIPVNIAKRIGSFMYEFKFAIFIYVALLFFVIPFLLIKFS